MSVFPPVNSTKYCRVVELSQYVQDLVAKNKLKQGCLNLLIIRLFVQPPQGKNKLYLFCTACFSQLSTKEILQAKESKNKIREMRQKLAEENKLKRRKRMKTNMTKLKIMNKIVF